MVAAKELEELAAFHSRLLEVLGQVILGQREAMDHATAALLCNGHVLLTGGAACAKGLLAQGLARALQLQFNRVQFTPDLMPSDITCSEVLADFEAISDRVIEANYKFPWSFICRALAGVDTAVWDWLGRRAGKSVRPLLGGTPRPIPDGPGWGVAINPEWLAKVQHQETKLGG